MKRRRGAMEMESEIRSAILELSKIPIVVQHRNNEPPAYDASSVVVVTTAAAAATATHAVSTVGHVDRIHIPTIPFLNACNFLLLQVLDKIGPTMAVLRQDVHQNIQRLEKLYESNPSLYSNLVEILKKEARERTARKTNSCTRALVWLTRSLDFTVSLLGKLLRDPGGSMKKAVEESYEITLKPWHRWISAAAYQVALRLVPDESKTFLSLLMAHDLEAYDELKEEIQSLISLLLPILDEIHSMLRSFQSDRLKSSAR